MSSSRTTATRSDDSLLSFLREFSAVGRDRVYTRVIETTRYSPEAREARELYRIEAHQLPPSEETAGSVNEIYMGLVFTSGAEEFIIPFFDRGLPVEYEILPSGYGYVRIYSFFDNELLTIQLWERMIQTMNDFGVPGLIVDMRQNGGGSGFLADVCREWEEAAEPARKAGIRVVHLRIGVVLSPLGGALEKMLTPFRAGAGGVIGSGKQYMSWISIDDLCGVIQHAIATPS